MQDPGADGAGGWGLFDPHRSLLEHTQLHAGEVLGSSDENQGFNAPKILCLVKEDPVFFPLT